MMLTIRLHRSEKGGRKNWLLKLTLVCARPFRPVKRGVKRTQTAAPPHHAVAPDIAESRSQVNRVVRLNRNKRIKMFRQEL